MVDHYKIFAKGIEGVISGNYAVYRNLISNLSVTEVSLFFNNYLNDSPYAENLDDLDLDPKKALFETSHSLLEETIKKAICDIDTIFSSHK